MQLLTCSHVVQLEEAPRINLLQEQVSTPEHTLTSHTHTLTSFLIWGAEGEEVVEEEAGQQVQSARCSHLSSVAHGAASQGRG